MSEAFIEKHEVRPWVELPNWMPEENLPWVRVDKAIAAGLTFRPIADTIRDALAWDRQIRAQAGDRWRWRLAPEREAELLKTWHETQKQAK